MAELEVFLKNQKDSLMVNVQQSIANTNSLGYQKQIASFDPTSTSISTPFDNFDSRRGSCVTDAPADQQKMTTDEIYGVTYTIFQYNSICDNASGFGETSSA